MLDGIGAPRANAVDFEKPIYLTEQEIVGITNYRRSSAQLRWLREQGFKAKLRADRTVLVSRAHFERVMGAIMEVKPEHDPEPRFDALL